MRARAFWIICLLLPAAIGLKGCGDASGGSGDGDALRGRLVITGSSTVAPLVGEIARRFEQQHPGVRIDVLTGGSSQAIADAQRGTADIGMVSRPLKEAEEHLLATTIALDGIAMIVHRDNDIEDLGDTLVRDIFTGRVRNWRDAGGHDGRITVVNKAEGRATLALFLAHYGLQNTEIRPDIVIGDNQHGIRTVAGNPNAIGYVSIGTTAFEASRGVAIRMPRIAGVDPTLDNVRSGAFLLVRPLNLITHGPPTDVAEAFIAFASSQDVRDLVEAQYFVPPAE